MFILKRNGKRSKGLDLRTNRAPENDEYSPYLDLERRIDFSSLKYAARASGSSIVDIDFYKKMGAKVDKESIYRAIQQNNKNEMRNISNYFFKANGMYGRLCRYFGTLYKYDYIVTPIVIDKSIKGDKIIEGFIKSLMLLDESNAKKVLSEVAMKVIRDGVYYGYRVQNANTMALQELPPNFCRSRFFTNGKAVVEFNMQYFDQMFPDATQRVQILKTFPVDFQRGYDLFKRGLIPPHFQGDTKSWHTLDVDFTVKFSINGDESPFLINVIPSLIDLAEAKEIDRKRMAQQLLKIVIQRLPLDKNNDLIFDVDEAKQLHNNAVDMLSGMLGVDVLTSFAEIDIKDISSKESALGRDEIEKVERGVFNEAGVSQMQFNTSGNLALEKSLLNDEASLKNLHQQFQDFLNEVLDPFNKNPKRLFYKVQLLETTIFNYKELSKTYKEQMQIGFSKFLPQVALGQSQLDILATAYFENEILNLNELFVPPAMSSTTPGGAEKKAGSPKEPGRPSKPDDEKSQKTIDNIQSKS